MLAGFLDSLYTLSAGLLQELLDVAKLIECAYRPRTKRKGDSRAIFSLLFSRFFFDVILANLAVLQVAESYWLLLA